MTPLLGITQNCQCFHLLPTPQNTKRTSQRQGQKSGRPMTFLCLAVIHQPTFVQLKLLCSSTVISHPPPKKLQNVCGSSDMMVKPIMHTSAFKVSISTRKGRKIGAGVEGARPGKTWRIETAATWSHEPLGLWGILKPQLNNLSPRCAGSQSQLICCLPIPFFQCQPAAFTECFPTK